MYIFGSITLFFIVNILVNILATDIPIKLKKHRNEIEERNQKLRESGQYYNKNEIRVVVDQLKYAVESPPLSSPPCKFGKIFVVDNFVEKNYI